MEAWLKRLKWYRFLLLTIALLWGCAAVWVAAHHHARATLLMALGTAAFVLGSLIGFIFTSYADETATIGKLTNWITGALAGVTVVEFRRLRSVLAFFALTTSSYDFALTLAVAAVFTGLGFYFMFFGRELFFNVPLAERRAQRALIEKSPQASLVTMRLNNILPTALLLGTADAESILADPDEAASLRVQLYSDDVSDYLAQSDEALKEGRALDFDVLSKVANLQYYRAYLGTQDAEKQRTQQVLALHWIMSALVLDPGHIDLSVKRADMLALLKRWQECVSALEALLPRIDCPFFVEEWLGYYLLYLPRREAEALQRSQAYLRRFPESNEAQRNIASAYAQRACQTARTQGQPLDTASEDYRLAIGTLKDVLRTNPAYLKKIQDEWSADGGSFDCFRNDPGYLQATGQVAAAK